MRTLRNRGGFTLAEVLFAFTASVLLGGGILGMFIVFSRIFRDGSEQLCLLSRARYGIERICAGASAAEVITVQQGGNELAVTVPASILRSAVNATHSTLHVKTTEAFPPSGVVYVEEEAIAYGATDSKKKSLLSCTRGYNETTASKHDNKEVVYIRFSYYLDGSTIYFNASGNKSPSSDEAIVEAVEPRGGSGIFQLTAPGGGFRASRVTLSFRCYDDRNRNGSRDASEPSLDAAFEVFGRNS